MYQDAIQCAKLTVDHLPPYPESEDDWPVQSGTDMRVIRFHWDREWSDKHNYKMIVKISEQLKSNGAQFQLAMAAAIAAVSDDDRLDSVKTQFIALYTKVKSTQKNQPAAPQGDDGEHAPQVLSTSAKQTRARGKLKVRLRKREAMALESEWRDKKYDTAFVTTLMSADEDEVDEHGKLTGRYVSKAPIYRSEQLKNLLENVDAVEDPKPSTKYKLRVRGEPVDIPPAETKSLANKVCRWMVDNDWLKENTGYDVPSRLAASGRLWGDEDDPEEVEAEQKRAKDEKEEAKRKRPKLEDGKVAVEVQKRKKKRGPGNAGMEQGRGGIDPALDG
ncbi:hypothetical protein HGRIS_010741 [Hohenbuehelia grisea]|uniref:Uncharacterized protein n=1 Tax=Hohenbuehelia grisea TaxID=104357 RepID=A0ABR3IXL7_9AGAR